MTKPTYVLGINCYDHDTSACLLRDGQALVAINKERLTREKNAAGFFGDPVAYCCFAAGIELEDVDLVVRNSYLLLPRDLEALLVTTTPSQLFPEHEREAARAHPLFLGKGPPRVVEISHHLAHAYSAFACSPYERGALMVVDGVGSYASDVTETMPAAAPDPLAREGESYYAFDGRGVEPLKKVWLPRTKGLVNEDFFNAPGVGGVYSRVSSYVFGHWNRCGEVMGLAPYGKEGLPRLFELDGEDLVVHDWPADWNRPFEQFDDAVWSASPHRQHWADLAWRVQADTEDVLLARARWLHERTGATRLALAGGVALNCVANGRIVEETPFEEVFIQPAAGDDGIALGCALYGHLEVLGQDRDWVMTHPYLGMPYPDTSMEKAVARPAIRASASARKSTDVAAETAGHLAAGAVVGWLQGGGEWGPRALGNRSILADPRDPGIKDRVNARVKFRQGFRPFAPAVLAEEAAAWFEMEGSSPFMLQAHRVRADKRDQIPGVVHVDGTARVQTVHAETNPRFHALLSAFHAATGCPVLLNTSFNVRGEPIVESPLEATDAFLGTDLDVLVLGDWIVRKRAAYRMLRPVWRRFAKVRQAVAREAVYQRAVGGVVRSGMPSS